MYSIEMIAMFIVSKKDSIIVIPFLFLLGCNLKEKGIIGSAFTIGAFKDIFGASTGNSD